MKLLQTILGLILSLVFILLAFRGTDTAQVLSVAGSLLSMDLLPATAIFYLMFILRAERWRLILHPKKPGFFVSLRVFTIAAGAVMVIPARLGEFARPLLLGRRGWSRSAVMATVIFERVLDGLSQVGLFLIVIMLLDVSERIRQGAWLACILYGGVFIILLLLRSGGGTLPPHVARLLAGLPRIQQWLEKVTTRFHEGLAILNDLPRLMGCIFLSALSWFLSVYLMKMVLIISGIPLEHPWLTAAFLQLVISLGSILPAAPGQIGTFHYFAKLGLTWFGVDDETALGFAVGLHAFSVLLLILPSALCFPFEWSAEINTSGSEPQNQIFENFPQEASPTTTDQPDNESGRQEGLHQ